MLNLKERLYAQTWTQNHGGSVSELVLLLRMHRSDVAVALMTEGMDVPVGGDLVRIVFHPASRPEPADPQVSRGPELPT